MPLPYERQTTLIVDVEIRNAIKAQALPGEKLWQTTERVIRAGIDAIQLDREFMEDDYEQLQ